MASGLRYRKWRLLIIRIVSLVLAVLFVAAAVFVSGPPATAQESLSISGTVSFHDDGDGVRQPRDSGMARRRMLLSGPDGISKATETNTEGNYSFTGLAPGSYVVSLPDNASPAILISPEKSAIPPFTRNVELVDSSVTGIDFVFAVERLTGFRGLAFVNAAPADNPKVRAFIDGVDCTGPAQLMPTDMDPATFWISVLSSDLLAGCGDDGDVVTFTINGLAANETAVYTPRLSNMGPPVSPPGTAPEPLQDGRGWLILTAGPPFALFWPDVDDGAPPGESLVRHSHTVVALIDGKVCGVGQPRVWESVMLIVTSEAGCGRNDARISFAVNGFATGTQLLWQAGDGGQLNLTVNEAPGVPASGPGFAFFTVSLPGFPEDLPGQFYQNVEAQVNGKMCGYGGREDAGSVLIPVMPAALDPACGTPGATITFVLNGRPFGTAPWQPGFHEGSAAPGIAQPVAGAPQDEATPVPAAGQISPPSVGDGGMRSVGGR